MTLEVHSGGIEALAQFVSASPKGQRNTRLHWAAARAAEIAARNRITAESAGRRLVLAAAAGGYHGQEVARTIDSAFRRRGLRFG